MTREWRGVSTQAVAIAAALLLLAAGFAGGLLSGARLAKDAPVSQPEEDSVDAGFSRDMQRHHAQAVQMSTTVRERTTDPEVRTLALDIALTQQQQIGQMHGWLNLWQLPQSSPRPAMAWMEPATPNNPPPSAATGHDGGGTAGGHGQTTDDQMPGMATQPALQRLAGLSGAEAERMYLQLMIPHHRGALGMAHDAGRRASQPSVRRLAQSIVESQTAEITVLETMLDARGGPLPPP